MRCGGGGIRSRGTGAGKSRDGAGILAGDHSMPGRPYRNSMFSLCGIGVWTEKKLRHGMRLVDCTVRLNSDRRPFSSPDTLEGKPVDVGKDPHAPLQNGEDEPFRRKNQQVKGNQHERRGGRVADQHRKGLVALAQRAPSGNSSAGRSGQPSLLGNSSRPNDRSRIRAGPLRRILSIGPGSTGTGLPPGSRTTPGSRPAPPTTLSESRDTPP